MASNNIDTEEILIELRHIESDNRKIEYLQLTHTNLYIKYERKPGLFFTAPSPIETKSLSDIKIENNRPAIRIFPGINGCCFVQIKFKTSLCTLKFSSSKFELAQQFMTLVQQTVKKDTTQESSSNYVLPKMKDDSYDEEEDYEEEDYEEEENYDENEDNDLPQSSQSTSKLIQTFLNIPKQAIDYAVKSYDELQEQKKINNNDLSSTNFSIDQQCKANSYVEYCTGCGTKLSDNFKFCPNCGIAKNTEITKPTPKRKEFVGTIFKCPNCGSEVTKLMAICNACGHHLSGQKPVDSVREFSERLFQIESARKDSAGTSVWNAISASVNPVDSQKLSLIRNFPIPNTIEDIQEFILLSAANINVDLSKKSVFKTRVVHENNFTIHQIISDAWVSKMTQAYQKARLTFPNDSAFVAIENIYLDKMKELNLL